VRGDGRALAAAHQVAVDRAWLEGLLVEEARARCAQTHFTLNPCTLTTVSTTQGWRSLLAAGGKERASGTLGVQYYRAIAHALWWGRACNWRPAELMQVCCCFARASQQGWCAACQRACRFKTSIAKEASMGRHACLARPAAACTGFRPC